MTAGLKDCIMRSGKNLDELYQEFLDWRKNHPDSIYIVFRTDKTFWGKPFNRYIVTKGVELYRFFGDVVIETINGEEQLHNPIKCNSQRDATELCERLNAQYVHDNEPEKFAKSPNWQELYKQTHLAENKNLYRDKYNLDE